METLSLFGCYCDTAQMPHVQLSNFYMASLFRQSNNAFLCENSEPISETRYVSFVLYFITRVFNWLTVWVLFFK